MRLVSCIAPLLAAFTGPIVSAQEADASEILREDLGFRLERPAPGWRLLDETEVKKVQPRAVAGAISPTGVYGVVVVESAPEGSLIDIGRALADSSQLEDAEVELFETVEHGNRPAVHWTLHGSSNGIEYRHHITLVRHGDDLFRLVSWTRAEGSTTDATAFREFADAFSLVSTAPDPVLAAGMTADDQGAGWRVMRGIWQSPAFGLEIVPRGGWRVIAGRELWQLDTRATVALFHETSRATVLLFADRIATTDQAAWLRWAREESESAGEPRLESLLVSVDRNELELRMFTNHAAGDGGERARELSGELVHGETCTEFLAWYPVHLEAEAMNAMHSAFDSIHFLDDIERTAIARDLAFAHAQENLVGDGFALRQGSYRDFRFGLRWTPPDARFHVAVGEDADLDVQGAVLTLSAPELGLRGELYARPFSTIPHAEWHEAAVARANQGRTAERVGSTRAFQLGEAPALETITEPTGSRPTRIHVVTAETSLWAFELRLFGSPGLLEREAAGVEAAIAAFTIAREASSPTSTTSRAHYDDRLGFQLLSPGDDFAFTDEGAKRFWPLGTVASWTAEDRRLTVLALCGASATDGIDFHSSLARNSLPIELAEAFDGPPRVTQTTFAGRPARAAVWSSATRTVSGWIFDRDETLFLLLSVETTPSTTQEDVEGLFEFLP